MKKRLLIVDPDRQLNKINEKVLQSSGIVSELHIVCNGREALDYICSRIEKGYPLPDVIIFELEMPVMTGFQFVDEFRKLAFPGKANVELVVFSSSSSPRHREMLTSSGIKHFLSKPYLLRGLRDVISHMRADESDRFDNRKMFGLERSIH
jgi:CheY-like chemotaxis protein